MKQALQNISKEQTLILTIFKALEKCICIFVYLEVIKHFLKGMESQIIMHE